MPYYIMYQMDGDTVYRSLQSVSSININSDRQQLIHNNGTDLIPLSGLDTVTVFRDKLRKYVGEMADWDEVLFSMEQIHFYKENSNGQPSALFSFYLNDSIPDGYFVYTEFDEEGNPEYTNLNDSCVVIVNNIYGEYFDAVVIDRNMSSFSMDSVHTSGDFSRIYGFRAWQDLSPLQRANATWGSYMGGLNMALGGAAMLYGCAMLIPGVNIAAGVTIALAGAATFISGALLTTRASDQMLSDGSHTEGFQETATFLGAAGAAFNSAGAYMASGSIVEGAAPMAVYAATEGPGFAVNHLQHNPQNEALNAAYERAQQIRSMELSATGRATLLDLESSSVRLFGNVTGKLDPNDRFGILVAKDSNALTVEDCQLLSTAHESGEFYCDFIGLEPCEGYYYRSYYYASELEGYDTISPYIVTLDKKSFWMPGCITLYPDFISGTSYTLNGKFQNIANQPSHTVGFCYSSTNEEPTIDDMVLEQTISASGEFSANFTLQTDYVYYRAYGYVDGQVVYGETRMVTTDRYVLEKLYADTHGENWIHNDNWCTGEDLNNWYGIDTWNSEHVRFISLDNNNLNGDIEIVGLPYLQDIDVNGNQINSIFIGSCPSIDPGYGFYLGGIALRKLHFDNCLNGLGQHFIENVSVDTIVFTNMRNTGRIFFDNVVSNKIVFDNCQFDSQGIGIEHDSQVDLLYVNNCSIPSGRLGGDGLTHLYVSNSTFELWVVDAQYITLVNATIVDVGYSGRTVHVSYLSGPANSVWNAVYCLAYPENCDNNK